MNKSSKKSLRRAAAMLSAGVLAAAMAAPAAWAVEIPGVSEETSIYTGEKAGAADSNIHLVVLNDDGGDTNVISVTAPTDIYLAAKVAGEDEVVDFVTPSPSAAVIANLGSSKAKVASWTASAGAGLAKMAADESKGFWSKDATDDDMKAGTIDSESTKLADATNDSFWLQANGEDIAISCDSPTGSWTMNAYSAGHVGDSIELELAGQMRTPTQSWYKSNPVIDKVTWTFEIVD